MTNVHTKHELREAARAALHALTPSERLKRSGAICDRLIAGAPASSCDLVLVYLALPDEVNLDPLIEHLLSHNVIVGAPRVDWEQSTMTISRVTSLTEIGFGRHGMREPASAVPIPLESLDLAFIPGLAFDSRGARLGRGGGFYDRFLADLRRVSTAPLIAPAFDEQILPRVPMEGHDVAVDAIVTPTRRLGPDAARFRG